MNERIKIILINGICIVAISLLLFVAGTWWRMQAQFNLGNEAFSKGDFTSAVAGSIRLAGPGSTVVSSPSPCIRP